MHPNRKQQLDRTGRTCRLAVVAVVLSALVGCSASKATTSATTPGTAHTSLGTNPAAASNSSPVAPADTTGASKATVATKATTPPKKPGVTTTTLAAILPGGGGPDDPCGSVTLADVRLVLPDAPEGVATLPGGGAGAMVAGTCTFTVDPQHRVVIVVETGPPPIMAAAKAGAATQSDWSKVSGLGDAGYSTTHSDGSAVVFYVGDTQVSIEAVGVQDTAPVVALAKKAASSF